MKKHLEIRIKGIVQGVGFRPFIFNLAKKLNIKGIVINDTEGVLINGEADEDVLKKFIDEIRAKPTALSHIYDIITKELHIGKYFSKVSSSSSGIPHRS